MPGAAARCKVARSDEAAGADGRATTDTGGVKGEDDVADRDAAIVGGDQGDLGVDGGGKEKQIVWSPWPAAFRRRRITWISHSLSQWFDCARSRRC